ncbi:LysE family translocator [Microbulbifer hydrolyticus]|uniref:LysE family transporter n=1 Tax=Microbulbifer hydrolyticus TaxID=48074 RepID=A0A6P1TEV7_9GAMM|nr:LysE family translocator [Microbulbifer hydrolyticus]MBB5210200.1 threonine/homoserine/homoserine lactone efflux protein [Microbulbifer hydrolyticus]QHQ39292.1 LysE family transporter [Microbulbifer hydrolyticus]
MDWLAWLSLAGVCALGAMSPGPSLLVVVRNAANGFAHGAACAIAHGLGIGCYALLTALGLGLILTGSPLLFGGLQWAGALFLVYLGWKSIRAPAPEPGQPPATEPAVPAQSVASAAAQGFGIALFNPKVALFFAALFSQFVGLGQATVTKLAMAGLAAGIDMLWYLLVSAALFFGRRKGIRPGRWSHRLQQLFGVLLIALAARLLWQI